MFVLKLSGIQIIFEPIHYHYMLYKQKHKNIGSAYNLVYAKTTYKIVNITA